MFVLFGIALLIARLLGLQVSRLKVGVPIIMIVTVVNTIVFKFIEKHYEGGHRLNSEPELIQDPIPIQLNQVDDVSIGEEKMAIFCCGDLTEEERQDFKRKLENAWINKGDTDPELYQLLPAHDTVHQADALLKHSDDQVVVDGELEIDWDEIRLQMLSGGGTSESEVEQALVAEMMLEADRFMNSMSEADASAIALHTQEIWDNMSSRLPEQMLQGTNALIWRKTFELQAAVEQSVLSFESSGLLEEIEHEFYEP